MKRSALTNTVGYRVSAEQWRRLEEEAEKDEVSVHDWCREAALEKLQNLREATEQSSRPPTEIGTHPPAETENGITRSVNELLLLEKITRLEYLIEHGLAMQLSSDKTYFHEWNVRVQESREVAARRVKKELEG